MLAVVKKHRTNRRLFEIKGEIPQNVIEYFQQEYGNSFEIIEEKESELIDIFETDWFKKMNQSTTPGESIRIYRQNKGLIQEELGKKLGNFTKQHISDIENMRRSISKDVAKKLSKLFNVPLERFL
jgi:antitoxin component HigA of HigAB toxin-antitoxin module